MKNYLIYTASYFTAIVIIVLVLFGIGYAFEPGKYTLWVAIILGAASMFIIHLINKKLRNLPVPNWYKILNLLVWCVVLLVFGVYYN
jgi:hypothetical protein